jgi:hypothetical protein
MQTLLCVDAVRRPLRLCLVGAFVLVFAIAALAGAGPAVATADPLACTGYPQPRAFLESQAWCMQTPGQNGTDYGHACRSTRRSSRTDRIGS